MAKAPSTPARREYARNRQRKYRAANPDRVRGYECKYRASNLLMIRRNALRYARLNLPAPTRPMPELCERGCGRKASFLDHCHTTNVFRGCFAKGAMQVSVCLETP